VIIDTNSIIIKEDSNYIWFDLSTFLIKFVLKTNVWEDGAK
jgi:hypothetical protein